MHTGMVTHHITYLPLAIYTHLSIQIMQGWRWWNHSGNWGVLPAGALKLCWAQQLAPVFGKWRHQHWGHLWKAIGHNNRRYHSRGFWVGHNRDPRPHWVPLCFWNNGPGACARISRTWRLCFVIQMGLPENSPNLANLCKCSCYMMMWVPINIYRL